MFIDTHCHLEMIAEKCTNATKWEIIFQEAQKIAKNAHFSNVSPLITIGTTVTSSALALKLATHIHNVFCTLGIHPCDGQSDWQSECKKLETMLLSAPTGVVVGIGETGLDFYHAGFNKDIQKNLFKAHIELALRSSLPLVIHTRNAFDETLSILQEYKKESLRGVFHCFSEDVIAARTVIEHGFLIGIGGPITYPKNTDLKLIVSTLGLSPIVLETDAPFLPPQNIRGKTNFPEQIATIGSFIAELLQLPLDTVAKTTSANARALFGLHKNKQPPV